MSQGGKGQGGPPPELVGEVRIAEKKETSRKKKKGWGRNRKNEKKNEKGSKKRKEREISVGSGKMRLAKKGRRERSFGEKCPRGGEVKNKKRAVPRKEVAKQN